MQATATMKAPTRLTVISGTATSERRSLESPALRLVESRRLPEPRLAALRLLEEKRPGGDLFNRWFGPF